MALATRHPATLDDKALEHVYEQALTVLFRLLFVAYAEDKDLFRTARTARTASTL